MARIGDEEAARRLARAIASDIALYHDARLRAGDPVDAEVAEGRVLFQARVEPQLFPVYEAQIDLLLGPRRAAPLTDHRHAAPQPFAPDPELERPQWPGRVLLITIILLVFAAVVLALIRR